MIAWYFDLMCVLGGGGGNNDDGSNGERVIMCLSVSLRFQAQAMTIQLKIALLMRCGFNVCNIAYHNSDACACSAKLICALM